MAFLRRLVFRLLTLLRADRAETDLAREINSHLALLEERFVRDGMAPDEAALAARRAFGGVEQAKERQRDARSFRWIEDAGKDAVFAVRSLSKSPAFTIAAVLTLAIGIGATTTIYSVVDRVLLQPLPFPDADRLIRVVENERPPGMQVITYQEYLEWRTRTRLLSGMAAATYNPQALIRTRQGAVRLAGGTVSTNYFEVIGAAPLLGRAIHSSDDANPDVVVLSFETWQRYFHADPSVIGTAIEVRSGGQTRLLTIIGVMPDGLEQTGGHAGLLHADCRAGQSPPGRNRGRAAHRPAS